MLQLDVYGTLVAASLVLLAGRMLVSKIGLLKAYTIPEPVAGGLIVALGLLVAHSTLGFQVKFDASMQAPMMLTFFACIGLNADLASLRQGGRRLAVFLGVVLGLLMLQNLLGITLAKLLGLDPLIGLLAGSITLSGGHGTGAAWSSVFSERYGLASTTELAMACATFGLVLGGLIGGPVARFLTRGVRLPARGPQGGDAPTTFEAPDTVRLITAPALIETLALISCCLLGGHAIAGALKGSALELPVFVCALFVGVLLRNGLAALGLYQVFERAVSVLGNVALALFLAMALMSLRLWELSALALPMLVILASQTALMACYAIFVTFPVMGRSYDAAVIAGGHCGFGLGATPTAIANMQAVTDRFGPSHVAFLIVPMVGAFFIDIANALVIKGFLGLSELIR
ncbi:sodium/glutamate symporter [Niveibacterium sp. 24ML]|uniref:sodium/glutamate symporter n=1 Tax=Niveibacterium sp. 24ML TaxID=2985512 RepID=UPI00226F378C|nr:sodium/glutamate symporter [Niveibacterium sp. 24ML]MCX9158001.1 sodium/glutamate symporter [Niveibacterium sp. 24ML]